MYSPGRFDLCFCCLLSFTKNYRHKGFPVDSRKDIRQDIHLECTIRLSDTFETIPFRFISVKYSKNDCHLLILLKYRFGYKVKGQIPPFCIVIIKLKRQALNQIGCTFGNLFFDFFRKHIESIS